MGKTRQRRRQHIQKRKKFEGIENFTYFKFINNNTNYNSNNNKKTERNNNRCSLATDDRVVRRFDGFRTQKNVAVYTQGFGRPSFDMRQPLVGNSGGGWGATLPAASIAYKRIDILPKEHHTSINVHQSNSSAKVNHFCFVINLRQKSKKSL